MHTQLKGVNIFKDHWALFLGKLVVRNWIHNNTGAYLYYPVLQFLDEVFDSGMLLCLCAFVFRAVNRQRQSVSWASARKTEISTEARNFSAENQRAKLQHVLCSHILNKIHIHIQYWKRLAVRLLSIESAFIIYHVPKNHRTPEKKGERWTEWECEADDKWQEVNHRGNNSL